MYNNVSLDKCVCTFPSAGVTLFYAYAFISKTYGACFVLCMWFKKLAKSPRHNFLDIHEFMCFGDAASPL